MTESYEQKMTRVPQTERKPAAPYPECKETSPWKMTGDEYRQICVLPKSWKTLGWKLVTRRDKGERGIKVKIVLPDGEELYPMDTYGHTWSRSKYKDDHREKVKMALDHGLHVPPHVRREYPDLKPSPTHRRLPQTIHSYVSAERKLLDRLEKARKSDPDEYYRLEKQVRQAIKEREHGKIKLFPDIGLVELRNILKEAERLYR